MTTGADLHSGSFAHRRPQFGPCEPRSLLASVLFEVTASSPPVFFIASMPPSIRFMKPCCSARDLPQWPGAPRGARCGSKRVPIRWRLGISSQTSGCPPSTSRRPPRGPFWFLRATRQADRPVSALVAPPCRPCCMFTYVTKSVPTAVCSSDRKCVSGQCPGESGSGGQHDHGLT
jgi:hypothetical protein